MPDEDDAFLSKLPNANDTVAYELSDSHNSKSESKDSVDGIPEGNDTETIIKGQ